MAPLKSGSGTILRYGIMLSTENKMRNKYFIGTSGWNYPHWKGIFYPETLSPGKWLEYYTKFYKAVELNVTFYRLIKKETFQNWHQRVGQDFSFIVKGSRFITHIKRLKGAEEPLKLLLNNSSPLKEKLAALLWQLPPAFKRDLTRLGKFCKILKDSAVRQVFEFRHESWFDEDVFKLLNEYNYCLCIAHSAGRFPCVKKVTSDFLYLRFHGAESLYSSDYPDKELKTWANYAKNSGCRDIFAFFNNDANGYALKNAAKFRKLLGDRNGEVLKK